MSRIGTTLWRNAGFLCVAVVLVYCAIHVFDPPRLNWGDSMSDYNVMNSGRAFFKYGFFHLRLTPFLLDPQYMTAYDGRFIYTHYPQLPDLMNGVLRLWFRMTTLAQFRSVALLFSFTSLIFIYRIVAMYWSRQVAQVTIGLWVINPLWIQHADYLHHAPYGAFFGYGSVYFLARYLRDNASVRWFVASGVFLFFAFLASYDYWFFAPLLLALVTFAHYKTLLTWPPIRVLGTLALFAVASVAFKFGTNAWVLGGVGAMIKDLRFQYVERATDTITRSTFERGLWVVMYGRVARFFSVLLFLLAAFCATLPFARQWWARRVPSLAAVAPNPGVLFLVAMPFLYVFREVWMGQYYPGLLVIPFYAVGFATIIVALGSDRRHGRAVAGALILALVANSAYEDLTFPKAFLDWKTIDSLGARLDSVSARGQQIITDHVFDAAYRYYFDRDINAAILIPPNLLAPSLASLADPARHPRSGTPTGAIFLQDKHLTDELYDKGYYYLLGRYGFWELWADPPRYRATIDTIVRFRDSTLMAAVARMGERLYDGPDYALWRVKGQPRAAETPNPSRPH
jgi:hypothetical protein